MPRPAVQFQFHLFLIRPWKIYLCRAKCSYFPPGKLITRQYFIVIQSYFDHKTLSMHSPSPPLPSFACTHPHCSHIYFTTWTKMRSKPTPSININVFGKFWMRAFAFYLWYTYAKGSHDFCISNAIKWIWNHSNGCGLLVYMVFSLYISPSLFMPVSFTHTHTHTLCDLFLSRNSFYTIRSVILIRFVCGCTKWNCAAASIANNW